jgi:hypothetical protein
MDATKPCEFIGFEAMDATKPCEFIGFGATPPKSGPRGLESSLPGPGKARIFSGLADDMLPGPADWGGGPLRSPQVVHTQRFIGSSVF